MHSENRRVSANISNGDILSSYNNVNKRLLHATG